MTDLPLRTQPPPSQQAPSESFELIRAAYERLRQAEELQTQGRLSEAQAICEQLVAQYPRYFGALHTLGLIYTDQRDLPRALVQLVRAAMVNPKSWKTLLVLGNVYLRLGASEMAAQTLDQAARLAPQEARVHMALGEVYREEREYELAAEAFRRALTLERTLDGAAIGLARCCRDLGRYEEGARLLEDLARRGVRSIGILHLLGQFPPRLVSLDLLALLDRENPADYKGDAQFEMRYKFARGAALHRAGRHPEAWERLVEANQAKFATCREEAHEDAEVQQESLEYARQAKVKIRGGSPGRGRQAISLFILGPSRSGKTTLEKLVASLDGVKCGYENPITRNAIGRAFQTSGFLTAHRFAALPQQLEKNCRELYLDELEQRAGDARVFTSTLPGHINDAVRIAGMFPNVRFLFVKRDPDDVALRMFMTNYQTGNYYSYSLTTIRGYLDWYDSMVEVLSDKLPGLCRVVRYEEMVADPAGARRVAAELCGLPPGDSPPPETGDDRGCAAPYRELMAAEG